ncbi:MAG: hypothetical protein JWN71_4087 [Xanthobacteraceae bacterium]|nr:hypothetical protein [Xanthobacteraceae bacterium]
MERIIRGKGVTPSERLLADLGDHAFLDLWSYPNIYKKPGQELCDLLALCGDDVIIFSDKAIGWQADRPVEIAWPRFYRNAVADSVNQIRTALRWIAQHPDSLFIDAKCTQRMPIDFPPVETRRVHGVVVAGGAYKACQDYTKDDSGSFMVLPHIKGDMHTDTKVDGFTPFVIGDPNPDGIFIHVFDDRTIKLLLSHLNTMTDFTRYLNKRAEYIRSGKLFMAHGEEELLASYMNVGILTGEYNFEMKRKFKDRKAKWATRQGDWSSYLRSRHFFTKTLADKDSYSWDRLIGLFTQNVLEGTSVSVLGVEPSAAHSEAALRYMALEDRFSRRVLGEAVQGALKAAAHAKAHRFARTIPPSHTSANPTLAYIVLILAYPTELELKGGLPGGYAQYRETRTSILHWYCMTLLSEHRDIQTAVGIAIDASSAQTGRRGGSEDLIAVHAGEWTDELLADIAAARKHYDILREDRLVKTNYSRHEFPIPQRPKQFAGPHRQAPWQPFNSKTR